MKNLLLIPLLFVSSHVFAQKQIINEHGTYDFNYIRTVDKDDISNVGPKSALESSIDFYVDNHGFGKLFLFTNGGKSEFIINKCTEDENGRSYLFELFTVITDNKPFSTIAFIRFYENREVPAFFIKLPDQDNLTAFINTNIKP